MGVERALKKLIREEILKSLSKIKYNLIIRVLGDNIKVYHASLPFPPYIGLMLKLKMENDLYFSGKIIDIEWEDYSKTFNVICEIY